MSKRLLVLLPDGSTRPLSTFYWPTAVLMTAAFLLILSIFQPYWSMTLYAPQYPDGLKVSVYVNRLQGDVDEVDSLNHYLGMPKLNDGGKIERSISMVAVASMAFLLFACVFIHNRWAALAALPALAYPITFLADLKYILYSYGHSIDPKSPLGSSVKPFDPPVLGEGVVGQFKTVAAMEPGLGLAIGASALVLVGLWLHRRAYKPVLEASLRPPLAVAAALLLMLSATPQARAETHVVQPGQRIQSAIAGARPGDTIRVQPGTYAENVTIDRRITVEGIGHPVIDGSGQGTVVRLTAPGAVLRGFVVRGSGTELDEHHAAVAMTANRCVVENNRVEDCLFGIYADHADDILIRGNQVHGMTRLGEARRGDAIRLWYSKRPQVLGNTIRESRDVVSWYCEGIHLEDNRVEDGRYGIHFMYCNGARVLRNRLFRNSVGIYTMYSRDIALEDNVVVGHRGTSGYGLGFKDVDDATVRRNVLMDNRAALFMDATPIAVDAYCRVSDNLIAYNDIGVALLPSTQRAVFEDNTLMENQQQVQVQGAAQATTNVWAGNYWSDYTGYDANGDGLGDVAYKAEDLFESLADRNDVLRVFQASLAQQAVDGAARLFPMVRPRPKLVDERPRIEPVHAAAASASPLTWLQAWPLAILLFCLKYVRRPHRAEAPSGDRPELHLLDAGAAIEVRGLVKRFGTFLAVDGFNLRVAPGEAVALWGANGAGKTTVIRCLLGLLSCEGTLRVQGRDLLRDGVRARASLGYVPQELRFHDDLTVQETMELYAALRNAPTADHLVRVGLDGHRGKLVRELSGGMKQRLALALALLGDPPVLLLDEPTSNLDLQAREELQALLLDLKAQGKTLLFSAHHLEEVARVADRIVLLEQGRTVRDCAPSELRLAAGMER